MFIKFRIGQIDLWLFGNDQRKFDPFGPRALAVNQRDSHAQKDELADRASLCGSLLLKLSV